MTPLDRRRTLARWIEPSSQSEKDRQDRAERMIKLAIANHPAFRDTSVAVYAKGSYPNNTNVRLDSDVDIVVENRDLFYYEYYDASWQPANPHVLPYSGPWGDPDDWRGEVTEALVNYFGSSEVDSTGSVALVVAEKSGSRPSTDVVPSFTFRRYYSADRSNVEVGTKVFKTTGKSLINWPQQQLDNGRSKNTVTSRRYKKVARALKNAENTLVVNGDIAAKPSYLMECLAWNVPNPILTRSSLDDAFRDTLVWLWENLGSGYSRTDWYEPNRLKYLFGSHQKWTVQDAKDLVLATWKYLDY